jgi:hypothetical protein
MAGKDEERDVVAHPAPGAGQEEGRILLSEERAFIEPIFWKS